MVYNIKFEDDLNLIQPSLTLLQTIFNLLQDNLLLIHPTQIITSTSTRSLQQEDNQIRAIALANMLNSTDCFTVIGSVTSLSSVVGRLVG